MGDQSAINQRRQLAQMLSMGAMQPNQSAMASNSPLIAAMVPIMQALAARKMWKGVEADQQALKSRQDQDWQGIIQAMQGTPEQRTQVPVASGMPTMDDEGNQMPPIPTIEQVTPAQPGSREQIVQAMMQANDPKIRMAGLGQLMQPPTARWKEEQGPRGSLLQRNTSTGELKSVVGTEDPTLMQMLLQGQASRQEAQSDPNAPWRNVIDPKKRDDARIRFGAEADRAVEKANEEAATSQDLINDLDRFLFLNENNSTGGRYRIPGAKAIGSAISEDVSEMSGISDRLTPLMRQGLPGAASDRDVAMFRGGTVGLEKQPEANKNIALGLKAAHQNKLDKANFLANYVTQRGYSRNAEAEWRKYLNANPIFDHNAPKGSYALNQNRISYDEWVNSGMTAPSSMSEKQKPNIDELLKKY